MKQIDGLLTVYAVNKMVGLTTAVGIFRRCFPDFPAPAFTGAYKALYFKREEVIAWFKKHGVKYEERF